MEVIAKKYEQRDEKGETMALLKMLVILLFSHPYKTRQ